MKRKITDKETDDLWLKGYRAGYRDAVGDAHCGLIKGIGPLRKKVEAIKGK